MLPKLVALLVHVHVLGQSCVVLSKLVALSVHIYIPDQNPVVYVKIVVLLVHNIMYMPGPNSAVLPKIVSVYDSVIKNGGSVGTSLSTGPECP